MAVVYVPASDSEADLVAAEMAMKNVPADLLWSNTWFNDPVFLGSYPEEGLKAFGQAVPKYTSREMEIISAPVDFLGSASEFLSLNCHNPLHFIPLYASRPSAFVVK